MKTTVLAVALGAILVSCGGGDPVAADTPPCCKALPGPDDIGHATVLSGSTKVTEGRYLQIRDMAVWQTFWSEHTGSISTAPPLPPIDFNTSILAGVVVAQLNDCYFVNARRVSWAPSASAADHIEMTFAVQPPGTGCIVHELSVSRMFLEALPRSALNVVFVPVE